MARHPEGHFNLQECITKWRGQVTDPLQIGEIPLPPAFVRILFVGVAPTDREGMNKGSHFYSSSGISWGMASFDC